MFVLLAIAIVVLEAIVLVAAFVLASTTLVSIASPPFVAE